MLRLSLPLRPLCVVGRLWRKKKRACGPRRRCPRRSSYFFDHCYFYRDTQRSFCGGERCWAQKDTTTAMAGKTTLKKSPHINFWIFIAIIPTHLLFRFRRILLHLKSCSNTWRQRNVQKRSVMQIGQNFSRFSCVLSALVWHHLLKCILLIVHYILLFCVFMAVFFFCVLDVAPDTEFEDHNRNNFFSRTFRR